VGARGANNVVLIDTVTADADRADELAIAIKRKAAGENGNAVGESRIGAGRIEDEIGKRRAPTVRSTNGSPVLRCSPPSRLSK